jgi:hypothetical protein
MSATEEKEKEAEAEAEANDDDRALLDKVQGLVAEAVQLIASEKALLADAPDGEEEAEPTDPADDEGGRYLAAAGSRLARIGRRRKRRISDEDRRTVELTGHIAMDRIGTLHARARTREAQARTLVYQRLNNGTYFASVDLVWRPKAAPYGSPELFEALRRGKTPVFQARSVILGGAATAKPCAACDTDSNDGKPGKPELGWEDVYAKTKAHATNPDFEAAIVDVDPAATADRGSSSSSLPAAAAAAADDDDDAADDDAAAADVADDDVAAASSSASSQSHQSFVVWQSSTSSEPSCPSEILREIWTADILGKPGALLSSDATANLVPRCQDKAALYYDVAACVLGLDDDNTSWETLQKAIFGSRPTKKKTSEGAGEDDDNGEEGVVAAAAVDGTGIKNLVPNKIRLRCAMEYLDRRPCVLVVPVLDLDATKVWSGEAYQAIVLPGAWTDPDGDEVRLESICHGLGMYNVAETASPAQVEQARLLLERVVLGLAHSLHSRLGRHESNLTDAQKRMLARRLEAFRKIPREPDSVYVPEAIPHPSSPTSAPLKVRIVEFQSTDSTKGHPAPDPLLLAVRAAINWSWRNHQKVLESGEPEPPIHPLEAQAIEEFLAWQDHQQRPHTLQDVAAGLQQPDGYQGDDDDEHDNEGGEEGVGDDGVDVEAWYDAVP